MAMSADEIETMIKEALPNSEVVIEDLRGDGDHYSAHVKSELFNGKSKIQQHQMVYKAGSFHPRQSLRASPVRQSPQ